MEKSDFIDTNCVSQTPNYTNYHEDLRGLSQSLELLVYICEIRVCYSCKFVKFVSQSSEF